MSTLYMHSLGGCYGYAEIKRSGREDTAVPVIGNDLPSKWPISIPLRQLLSAASDKNAF